MLTELTGLATKASLRERVRSLAAVLRDRDVRQGEPLETSWIKRASRYGRFSPEDEALLVDLGTLATAAEAADSTWVVLLLSNNDWKELLTDDRIWMWQWPPGWW